MKNVLVPENVGNYIEYCKDNSCTLYGAFDPVSEFGESMTESFKGDINECLRWIRQNSDKFGDAWVNGYEYYPEKFRVYLRSNDAGSKLLLHKRLLEYGGIGYEWSCFNIDDKNHFTKSELIGLGLEWLFSCPDVELIRIYN